MADAAEVIILMDNGSLRAEASMQLRALARGLGARLGKRVYPVSLLHSSKVDAAELGGERAKTLVPFLREKAEVGANHFTIVPLFFGKSGAFVDYLPQRIAQLQAEGWEDLRVRVAQPLVKHGDTRVAEILAQLVREKCRELGWERPAVAMCDHGTPSREVNAVRELVAEQLKKLLVGEASVVAACSMERREGAEYAFNEPLLGKLLGSVGFEKQVIVSMLFAGPGRHAGANGDVAQICSEAMRQCPSLETAMAGLVGSCEEQLVAILADRYAELHSSS